MQFSGFSNNIPLMGAYNIVIHNKPFSDDEFKKSTCSMWLIKSIHNTGRSLKKYVYRDKPWLVALK